MIKDYLIKIITLLKMKYVTSSDYQMEFNNLNITIIDSIYNILESTMMI